MKFRAGFVSNSSTCSFLMYGVMLDIDTVKARLHGKGLMPLRVDCDSEWFDEFFGKFGLTSETVHQWGSMIIGRSWDTVGDEETGRQFKDVIVNALIKIFGEEVRVLCKTEEGNYKL